MDSVTDAEALVESIRSYTPVGGERYSTVCVEAGDLEPVEVLDKMIHETRSAYAVGAPADGFYFLMSDGIFKEMRGDDRSSVMLSANAYNGYGLVVDGDAPDGVIAFFNPRDVTLDCRTILRPHMAYAEVGFGE